MTSRLDWPDGIDRTPPSERERTRRYSVQFRQTEQEIAEEMERLGVESWWMDDVKGSGTDPGIVVRWRKDGKDYAVACDAYTTKKANARDVFLWLKESRKRDERETVTVGDNLAAAQLPPGDPEATAMGNGADSALPDGVEPHDILGVPPDASDDEVTERARELIIEYHPDQSEKGPEYVQSVKAARDAMTSG